MFIFIFYLYLQFILHKLFNLMSKFKKLYPKLIIKKNNLTHYIYIIKD
jgi:hypothetical protein